MTSEVEAEAKKQQRRGQQQQGRSPTAKDEAGAAKPERKHPVEAETPVDEASEESFPASDPPAWTGTTSGGGPEDDKK